ncbi:MAG: XrtA system polysaccharide deacetylase [Thermodesulfobacteriota bacterium]
MLNALTIDLEDYFQVHAFSHVVRFEDWGNYPSRIEQNTHRLLNILNDSFRPPPSAIRNVATATFFCLGWLAERYPSLIREIRQQGHEIACHGYSHKPIYTRSREEFREEIRKAKAILEDVTGDDVVGYRAPSYSITNKSQWAFKVLVEEGFKYDSSIFPIHHDFYGFPRAPRFPFLVSQNGNSNFEFSLLNFETAALQYGSTATQGNSASNLKQSDPPGSGKLIEFPISTYRICGQNIPISGGGYFRLLPYRLIEKGLRRINQQEHQPFIFYIHPWELDPDQPRLNGVSFRSRFRHYTNLDKTESKFKNLLTDFNFCSVKELLNLNKTV